MKTKERHPLKHVNQLFIRFSIQRESEPERERENERELEGGRGEGVTLQNTPAFVSVSCETLWKNQTFESTISVQIFFVILEKVRGYKKRKSPFTTLTLK